MKTLIGILGLKGSGKDTAAEMLTGCGFTRMAFADALYAEASRSYEVTPHFLARRDTKETSLERLARRTAGMRISSGCSRCSRRAGSTSR